MIAREYLFVYGTLKYPPHIDLLGEAIFIGSASVEGKIYLVEDTYPGFVEGRGIVLGQIYLVHPKQFKIIDEYEGDLYLRRKILTSSQIECWIYQYIRN